MPASPLSGPVRVLYLTLGLACVGLGGVGFIVPGLPSTIFFIGAATCFTKSSPRLERWVLELPGVGAMVRDHRAGLGMPRRAKVVAIASIAVFSGIAVLTVNSTAFDVTVAVAAVIGALVVAFRVPTRERELERRAAQGRMP